jgi:hypothetical protein
MSYSQYVALERASRVSAPSSSHAPCLPNPAGLTRRLPTDTKCGGTHVDPTLTESESKDLAAYPRTL